jgi:hypothetical protein
MELVARDLFAKRIDEPFAGRYFEFAVTFDSEFWHHGPYFGKFF